MPSCMLARARGMLCLMVTGGKRRAERAAGIAGCRLNPDFVETAVAQHLAIGDAIERDAAGETKIARSSFPPRARASSASTISSVTA